MRTSYLGIYRFGVDQQSCSESSRGWVRWGVEGNVIEYHPYRTPRILFEGVSTSWMPFYVAAGSYEVCPDQEVGLGPGWADTCEHLNLISVEPETSSWCVAESGDQTAAVTVWG